MIQKELSLIQSTLSTDINQNPRLIDEVSELWVKTENLLSIKSQRPSEALDLNPTLMEEKPSPSITTDIQYEVCLNPLKEKCKLIELDRKIRRLEQVLGDWKLTKQVNEALGEFVGKMRFCNSGMLEKLESQAKHLHSDLDILMTSKARVNVPP